VYDHNREADIVKRKKLITGQSEHDLEHYRYD
jgi:hypothetical protein